MIELRGIKKSFGSKVVLNGVDLVIPNGQTTCIIGRSGCGKSVLLKHIVGLLTADEGTVVIDGQDIRSLTKDALFQMRQKIGYVFQGAALFDSMSVFENIVIGLVEHGQHDQAVLYAEGRRVLSAVGLVPDQSDPSFEREFASLASKRPSDLSGGMKKRVGVARALVGNPTYIFYDEPTTGLDPVTSEQMDILLGHVASTLAVTSVVITHDMFSVYNIADNVVMLADGKVQFYGTVPELKSSGDPVVMEFLDRFLPSAHTNVTV